MWYVIQTVTGKEQELVDMVHSMIPNHVYKECFFMKRQLLKRLGGEWLEVTETLFPAYVFLDTEEPERLFYEIKRLPEFAKLLGDNRGYFIPLEEEERSFLRKLLSGREEERGHGRRTDRSRKTEQGHGRYVVKNTKVFLDASGAVVRLEGPLEAFQGKIQRINLRKRYAMIEISVRGEKQTALLGIRLEKDLRQ